MPKLHPQTFKSGRLQITFPHPHVPALLSLYCPLLCVCVFMWLVLLIYTLPCLLPCLLFALRQFILSGFNYPLLKLEKEQATWQRFPTETSHFALFNFLLHLYDDEMAMAWSGLMPTGTCRRRTTIHSLLV